MADCSAGRDLRLAQRLLEQGDRTIGALELCEEEEGLRP